MLKLKSLSGMGATDQHAQIILNSYERLLGKPLIMLEEGIQAAEALFESPIVILSHGTESDPILNYGNRAALTLWETDWQTFTRMPSRYTAEPVERAERERFMKAVSEQGYVDTYQGVRISCQGTRFQIQDATVFNLTDENGTYYGQAAAFAYFSPV